MNQNNTTACLDRTETDLNQLIQLAKKLVQTVHYFESGK